MRSLPLALLVLALVSSPAAGQAVVMPEKPLDAERAVLRDAVVQLRDSLEMVTMAGGRLRRDVRRVSGAALVSRARVVRAACVAAARVVPNTREAVAANQPSDPRRSARRTELLKALDELADTLRACDNEFGEMSAGDQGEQVRGYGPARTNQLRDAIRRYDAVADAYLTAYGIPTLPKSKVRLAG